MKEGMAEEDGEESELFFLRVVVVPLEVVVAAATLVGVVGIVELAVASPWVEVAGTGSTATTLIPSSPPPASASSVVDASPTFTLPNSSRSVVPILEALLGDSDAWSVVLFIVVSSATSSSSSSAAAAAAAMVKILCLCRRTEDGQRKFKIEIDSSTWREEIQNRNRLLDLAGRKSK